jgi:hypothetical protein
MAKKYIAFNFGKKSILANALKDWIAVRKHTGIRPEQAEREVAPFANGFMSVVRLVRFAMDNGELEYLMEILEHDAKVFVDTLNDNKADTTQSN